MTQEQVQEFQSILEADDSLDSVLDWIANNLLPEDVFDYDELANWARNHFYEG